MLLSFICWRYLVVIAMGSVFCSYYLVPSKNMFYYRNKAKYKAKNWGHAELITYCID